MLLDHFTPTYDFREHHAITIHASPHRVYASLHALTPADVPIVRVLMGIRTFPALFTRRKKRTRSTNGETVPLLRDMLRGWFTLLADQPDAELVIGTIGQFWKVSGGNSVRLDNPEAFVTFEQNDYAKAAMNFSVTAQTERVCQLSTETRIVAPDLATRRKFARYWGIIHLGSAVIRLAWLRAVKRRAESPAIAD